MQPSTPVFFWKTAPFTRLLPPLIAGILLQEYADLPVLTGWGLLVSSGFIYSLISLTGLSVQFRLRTGNGLCIHALLFAAGMLLVFYSNIRNSPAWINNYYSEENIVLATIEEPLSEKTNSYKANASVREVIRGNGESVFVKGNVLLYFQKDSSLSNLHYGNQIAFKKTLQPIKNSGNPGSFNYQQFCDFRNISHQVFLRPGEFVVLKIENQNLFKKFLFAIQHKLVEILSKNISGEKEAGLAEAMLIGYKDDLDKNLLQSYSNTGVIHIIAISGLHLGLIYAILSLLCRPLGKRNVAKWVRPVIIISGLWLFSLAAGGSASILRAAVMFTCLVLGESISRKSSVYNSLALSAFLLLCYNPYWLWDVGFQLSYAALLSIVLFMKPIYNSLFIKNKMLDAVWKLVAVTLAAQILTIPLGLYHFHQFPVLFLVANIIAVPVSSIILLGEIICCALAFIPVLAQWLGIILHWIIFALNTFIETIDRFSFAVMDGFQISSGQLLLVYITIGGFSWWLLQKKKSGIALGLIAGLWFTALRTHSFWQASQQQKMIVYNIPKYQAIDFVCGRTFVFKGDNQLKENSFLQNFHLKPSRTLHRISPQNSIANLNLSSHFISFGNKVILLADSSLAVISLPGSLRVDILLLTKNPQVYISQLCKKIKPQLIIIDASSPLWKINRWKQECARLGLAFHSVSDHGAFVLNLQ